MLRIGRNENDISGPQVSNALSAVEFYLTVQDHKCLWLTRVEVSLNGVIGFGGYFPETP